MKIKFWIAGLALVSTSAAFAQKGVLNDANEAYGKYSVLKGAQVNLALTNLNTAKELIDKASANEKTANLPLTFAVKGGVYAALASNDTIPSTSTPLFITAEDALKKATELDTKGENKKLIEGAYTDLARYKMNMGVKAYGAHNYTAAYESFNYYQSLRPTDTTAIYYTGLAALNARKYDLTITNYKKLLSTAYSNKVGIYSDLTTIYLLNKDTTGAMNILSEAVEKYPNNGTLSTREIQLYLQQGKVKEVSAKLDKAIANDPKNKNLYYYSGYTYLQEKNYDKAIEQLKKSLDIDPDFFEANLNMGAAYLNPGIELFNKANKLPTTKSSQKQYDDLSAQAVASFDKALPYLIKATEIDPKSVDALSSLRNAYLGKKDNVNANLITKKLDALRN